VQFRTVLGTFNVELFPAAAPITVPNFLNYVNAGRFDNSFVHRSDKGLGVIQGGGFVITSAAPLAAEPIATETDPMIALEYNLANTRGTIAMARTGEPNSAQSGWFINMDDNSIEFGPANGGGYAVFGRVTGSGMTVADAIHALNIYIANPFTQLPLIGFTGSPLLYAHLVVVNAVESIPIFPNAAGQNSVVNFSVTNTNPTLITAEVSGSLLNLTLAAGYVGTADLTVTATDTNGQSAEITFRVNVTGPPPEIVVEQPVADVLNDGGSRAFPLVNPGSTAELTFTIKDTGDGGLLLTGTPRVIVDGPDARRSQCGLRRAVAEAKRRHSTLPTPTATRIHSISISLALAMSHQCSRCPLRR
jgi:cyclophilin family peptidyl-prolyl cis-trans isomerase